MGWTGDFETINDALDFNKRWLKRDNTEILAENIRKNYCHLLVKDKKTGELEIMYFIYRNKMYKDILWCDAMHISRTPKKWIPQVEPFLSEFEKECLNDYRNYLQKKKSEPKLDDILERGKTYKVFGTYTATYLHKEKRSHIFFCDGKYTRFVGLRNISQIEKLA